MNMNNNNETEMQATADVLIEKFKTNLTNDSDYQVRFYSHQMAMQEALENMRLAKNSHDMIYWMDVAEIISRKLRNI